MVADDVKLKALKHVRYEIEQLFWLVHACPERNEAKDSRGRAHWMEGVLLRARILNDLFLPRHARYPDDIRASDYGFNEAAPLGKELMDQISMRLAHLSYKRVTQIDDGWDVAQLEPLFAVLRRLVDHTLSGCSPVPAPKERSEWERVLSLVRDRWPAPGGRPGGPSIIQVTGTISSTGTVGVSVKDL